MSAISFNADDPSWAELTARANTTPKKIALGIAVLHRSKDPYSDFVILIERALDFAAQEMAKNRNVIKDMDEDQLTTHMLGFLVGMSFDAHHDKNVGGHCDITVEGDDEMLWLGEAKIYKSYANLFKGFRQLVDRYSTGLPRQDAGAMIIYSKSQNTLDIVNTWSLRLARALKSVLVGESLGNLWFRSRVPHAGSGRMLEIKHMAVVLYHNPTDTLPTPKAAAAA